MRRINDFYPTPGRATEILLELCPELLWSPVVFEPCNGKGAISDVVRRYRHVVTADIDPDMAPDYVGDARSISLYDAAPLIDKPKKYSVITNPPFNQAIEIVSNFVERQLLCAFLLRLSFLEPTDKRGRWLENWAPNRIIVLPRISFTGDGKTDSVTCAWFIWGIEPGELTIVSKERFNQPSQQIRC